MTLTKNQKTILMIGGAAYAALAVWRANTAISRGQGSLQGWFSTFWDKLTDPMGTIDTSNYDMSAIFSFTQAPKVALPAAS